MKRQNIFVVTVFSLLAVSCSDIDSTIPCTVQIDWIPSETVVKDSYSVSQKLTLVKNSVFEADIDFSQLGAYSYPYITVGLTNMQGNKLMLDVIELRVYVGKENLPVKRIDMIDYTSCKNPKCASPLKGGDIDNLAITSGGLIKLNYYFEYRISKQPVEAKAEVKIRIKEDDDQKVDIARTIYLAKYVKRYNCVWGEGHPYRSIENKWKQ